MWNVDRADRRYNIQDLKWQPQSRMLRTLGLGWGWVGSRPVQVQRSWEARDNKLGTLAEVTDSKGPEIPHLDGVHRISNHTNLQNSPHNAIYHLWELLSHTSRKVEINNIKQVEVRWYLTFGIANATLLHDPLFLREHMFNNRWDLRKLVFVPCLPGFLLTQLDSSFNGEKNKFTKVFSFKIGIFSLVVKCMQKACDYGIYVSIRASSTS